MMKPKIELSKKSIILISSIVVVGIIFVFVVGPLFGKVRKIANEAKTLDNELELVRQAIKNSEKINKKGHLLSRAEVSKAIDEIITVGGKHNISFLSTGPQKIQSKQGSKYPVLPIHLEVQSKYENFGIFLGALENLDLSIVTVREFSMDRQTEVLPEIVSGLVIEVYLKEGEGG